MRQYSVSLLIFICSVCSDGSAFSQSVIKPTRQSSIEAFSNGKYDEAYVQFTELLKLYPRDPLYKYYSGVCLVNTNKDPDLAASLLQDALKGAAAIRTLPSDAMFFLGRSQQMAGRFSEAIDSYRKYEDQAGKKVSKEKGIENLIQECLNKKGQITVNEITASVTDSAVLAKPVKTIPPANIAAEKLPSETRAPVKETLPPAYEKLLEEALKYQFKADSLRDISAAKRQKLATLPATGREAEKKNISEADILAASFQKKADQKFNEANILKSGGTITAATPEKMKVLSQDTIKPQAAPPVKPSQPVVKAPQKDETGVFSVFEVVSKPAGAKIEIDPEVPEGLVYRIQLAVFRNPVTSTVFKGITPVYGFRITSNGLTYYYAGMFRRSADASKALVAVKSKGFKDSFVVPFLGKKPVSAERGAVMEKEWGKVPLFREVKNENQVVADTLPPTLVFRIEVTRSKKPLDEKKTEELKKVAGNRGLDVLTAEDGSKIYLIGKFITFESAAEYNDILVRNGYIQSKVVSWIGKREIPVETARRLFENIK